MFGWVTPSSTAPATRRRPFSPSHPWVSLIWRQMSMTRLTSLFFRWMCSEEVILFYPIVLLWWKALYNVYAKEKRVGQTWKSESKTKPALLVWYRRRIQVFCGKRNSFLVHLCITFDQWWLEHFVCSFVCFGMAVFIINSCECHQV